ncbi:uncharacterized protein L969DRAFT_44327 [Mixia osmundae IAM 14324]|uniref:Uncharacterized protein n=1 Tax=Mixia osmundae (strain CBS 9802 / IAM 14324 / JCM 22182 / KY 12970) TaxID=764103 RepID=G7DT89_MIXOS|nr:uncharacterized protein L969DRAFT_44327 [Mixia osmundae IAM 14324]KEI42926.1 hypothetical protein L969DRAFT_44327 [Mixia osmundae IAM 14324]GAA93736.1 hypothetical protein E5Q_00382 [Mixia osmundae IAM 14324]
MTCQQVRLTAESCMSEVSLLRSLEGHKGPVNTVVYNSNGSYCLSGGQDRSVKLWNPTKASLIKSYEAHGYEVLGISVSHDSTRFASCGGDRSVFLWDVATGATIKRLGGHTGRVNAVAFNADATVLASGSFDATVRLWDIKAQSPHPIQILPDAKDSITSIAINGSDLVTGSVDGTVRWYDLRMGVLRSDLLDAPVTSVAISRDRQTILASSLDSAVRLMDASSGDCLQTYKGHKNDSYRVQSCFGYAERTVMSGDESGQIFVWDLAEGRAVQVVEAHTRSVLWLSQHPSADEQLSCGRDGAIHVWHKSDA